MNTPHPHPRGKRLPLEITAEHIKETKRSGMRKGVKLRTVCHRPKESEGDSFNIISCVSLEYTRKLCAKLFLLLAIW